MCMGTRIGFATDLIFLPRPWLQVSEDLVVHDSQISRGGETAHIGQCVYRASVGRVYARGKIKSGGEVSLLPYWHELAATLATPSATSITETQTID